jgi:hypothetical protein
MAWRPSTKFRYEGLDRREPAYDSSARISVSLLRCKHFGKAISVDQWETTCDYFEEYFPEPYKTKWRNRKGKAIHIQSDFSTPLYGWEEVHLHVIQIHP